MKVHIVVLIVLFSVMFRNVCGQTVGVRGAMSEEVRGLAGQVFSDQKGVVPYAHVFFIHGKDTIPLVCDAIGVFSWHTAHVPDTLQVRVTAIGYKTLEAHYYPKTQGNRLLIRIQQEAVALNEVIVTAKKVYMVVKGDTLEYKAETFMALEGDFIGNLLKKLPGVSFENGLTINGEPIARIYVNGEDFGGTGNVLSNIKADNVKDIQVYDERNKEDLANGMKYGRRETVMNVVTKKKVDRWKDWRNGTFLLGTGRDVSNNSTSRFKQKLNLKFNYKVPLENADSKLKTGKSLNIEGEYTNIGKANDVQASKFTLTYRNKFQGLERDKKLYYKTNNTFTNNRNYSRILNNRVYFPTSDYTSRVYEARKVDEQEMWQFDTKHHFAYKQMHWSLGIRSEKKEEDRNSQERSETNDSLISAVSMQYRLKNVNSSGNAELSLILLKKINFNSSFDFGQRKTESLQIDTISESNRHFLLDQKYDHQNMEWTTTISYGRMLSLFSSLFEYTYRTSMNKENGESVNRLTNSLDTNGTRDYSFYQQIHELSGRLNYYSKKNIYSCKYNPTTSIS